MDEKGRALKFSNGLRKKGDTIYYLGGVSTRYKDSEEERSNNTCYVSNVKCLAEEHRFGGVVIQPV